ncbi:MAG: ORF6N domain-containing protein [Bacteroidaceae bacterium]|nr:ORF6N domain-containing protein [Bacteroidaceae bacterium]
MNDIQTIQSKIYEIRGQRVMLDFDLAAMYGIETKALKRAVRRNIQRFPQDFMFEVTPQEQQNLRYQIDTSSLDDNRGLTNLRYQNGASNWGGNRYNAFAFTELGVAMLSSVLNSNTAIDINIKIMRAFVEFRHLASSLTIPTTSTEVVQLRKDFEELKLDIEDILANQNEINEDTRAQLDAISTALAELQPKESKPRRRIGFVQEEEK